MSSLKERKQTNCLNCNAELQGRYCHVCGQENTHPDESFWHLTSHFVADLFHYDGKFLRTLKYLIFRPGYLAKEHIKGRRVDYLHPIRLYVFISAVFFLCMYLFINKHETVHVQKLSDDEIAKMKMTFYQRQIKNLKDNLSDTTEDSQKKQKTKNGITKQNSSPIVIEYNRDEKDSITNPKNIDSSYLPLLLKDSTVLDSLLYMGLLQEKTEVDNIDDYIAYQKRIPEVYRDNFIQNKIRIYILSKEALEKATGKEIKKLIIEDMIKAFPKILFFSLPIVAFVLLCFYYRKRWKFNYVFHLLFGIYLACAFYIFTLFSLLIGKFTNHFHFESLHNFFEVFFGIIFIVYTYKSFRVFYQQGRFKTILKIILLTMPLILVFIFSFSIGWLIIAMLS